MTSFNNLFAKEINLFSYLCFGCFENTDLRGLKCKSVSRCIGSGNGNTSEAKTQQEKKSKKETKTLSFSKAFIQIRKTFKTAKFPFKHGKSVTKPKFS